VDIVAQDMFGLCEQRLKPQQDDERDAKRQSKHRLSCFQNPSIPNNATHFASEQCFIKLLVGGFDRIGAPASMLMDLDTDGDDMPKISLDVMRRYGFAVCSVGLAVVFRLICYPVLGDRYPFFLFFIVIVLTAGYGGYGPSLLAVILSWLSVNYLFLHSPVNPSPFETRIQFAFAFFVAGLAVALLGGFWRSARQRAKASASELREVSEAQKAEREWLQSTISRDVTERHRAEQARRESEDRFHQLADHINLVFWVHELDGSKIGYVSPAYETIWGRTRQSLYDRPMSYVEAIHPEDRERALHAHQQLRRGEATADEYRVIRPDRTIRWLWDRGFPIRDELGRVVRLAGIAEDITERKQVEQALRESEERFRTLADATPVLIWGSGTDKQCNYFNKQWLDFRGRTLEQEMGNGWSEGVHVDDLKRCIGTYVRAFDARTPFTMEYRLERNDGEYRWVQDTGVPRFTPDGTFSGYIGSCVDITDRKRTEEEFRAADRRKEEFLAVLSHELRNPLAPIQTALDLLEHKGPREEGDRRELAMIKRQVQNLKRLVDDLLDVSRISRGKIELRKAVVELPPVIVQAVDAVRPFFDEHRQQLHVSVPEEPVFLEADCTRLEQILYNLMLNASKYTPEGGQVWLDVEPSPSEVVIRVRDTGIGIEKELLPKVFDLFLKGERRIGLSHEGSGIGLSLAKNLVELHGGTITALSHGSNMGSEFVVRLPVSSRVSSEKAQPRQAVQPDVAIPVPRWRILIVDDNVQAADSMGLLLSSVFGQEVSVVYDGKRALETAESFLPSLILLDLEMAGMDGYEVARRLRATASCKEALIVAVTGWGHEEDRRRSREMKLDLHLVKPVTANDLREILTALKPRLSGPCPGPLCESLPAPELALPRTRSTICDVIGTATVSGDRR
jgi:PAS domain S-box-containing protein